MNRVVDWYRHSTHKLWVSLEQETVPTPLAGLPWSGISYSCFSSPHPLIEPTLLYRYFRIAETDSFPSPLTPIIRHRLLSAPTELPGFSPRRNWSEPLHFLDPLHGVTSKACTPPLIPPFWVNERSHNYLTFFDPSQIMAAFIDNPRLFKIYA